MFPPLHRLPFPPPQLIRAPPLFLGHDTLYLPEDTNGLNTDHLCTRRTSYRIPFEGRYCTTDMNTVAGVDKFQWSADYFK